MRIEEDVLIRGVLRCDEFQPPTASIGDDAIDPNNPILATKLQHQHHRSYAQASGVAVATVSAVYIHRAVGDGTIVDISAAVIVACIGAATITLVIKKNGASITSGTWQIDSGDAARALVPAALTDPDYVSGDFFEITVTAAAGGGTLGQGLAVDLVVREDAQ